MVERDVRNVEAVGSIPITSTQGLLSECSAAPRAVTCNIERWRCPRRTLASGSVFVNTVADSAPRGFDLSRSGCRTFVRRSS